MEANAHPRQQERLEALRAYGVLDTEREKDFDDIVKLVAELCGTSIAVINLIDEGRQWFKAETGLGMRETPIETSICAHVILEDDFVEINDTLSDPRMKNNPLCCGEPGLRFYAGALLRTDAGLPLGTLCVLDYQPRSLTPLQRNAIRVLARQVMAQFDMRKTLRHAAILRQEVDHRVKNSLQSLSSFARLQHRGIKSEEAKSALSGLTARIDAMTRLHEQLYRKDDSIGTDLGSYVEQVCDHIAQLAPPGVALEVETTRVTVSAQQAVAVGTFLNEFVANSFKHAFPNGRAGQVRVRLEDCEHGKIRLSCADTGVGLPEGVDAKAGHGLGMKIAEVICMELDCDLDLDSGSEGLSAALVFTPSVPGQAR